MLGRQHPDAVVPPVAHVDEPPVPGHPHRRRVVLDGDVLGDGAHGLARLDATAGGVVPACRDRRVQLVHDVDPGALRVEGQVTGAGPAVQRHLAPEPQPAGPKLELVGRDRARAEVDREDPTASGIGDHHMGVRLRVLDNLRGRTEDATAVDRMHHDAPGTPMSGQHVPAARVHRQVTGLRSAARLGSEQPQVPAVADGERAHEPLVELVHGVERVGVERHRQIGRTRRTRRYRLEPEHPPAQRGHGDPLAASSGMVAQVDQMVIRG